MLTAEQNEELTQVAAGTPMGELLRRYWYPVAFTRELEEFPVRPARLLGEDFAVFKTPRGRYGMLPEACPHRRASLTYGVVETDGLRCPYHGWLFGTDGTCLDQPAEREETNFRDRVRAVAGQVQELGGLIWAYIGPSPAPELPRFDVFVMDGVRDIGWTDLPCNFVQIMENAVDPHHTEWLHGRFFEFMARHQGFDAPTSFGKKHVKVGFDAFEWGIIKRRVVEGASEEDDDWKIGHPLVFPYNMRVGGANIEQMQIRVVTDRTVEHLGRSDIGVTMLRRMFKENMSLVARGEDPLGVYRDFRDRIDLPCEKNKFSSGAAFAIDFIDRASSRLSPQAGAQAGGVVHRGWFPADAERHRRDAPRYCPGCAAALSLSDFDDGLTTE